MAPTAPTGSGKSGAITGIVLLLCAILIFSVQDAITKHLAQNYPVPFFLMIRYWAFTAFATAYAQRSSGTMKIAIRSKAPVLQILRALILVTQMGFFAIALALLKIADAHAIFAIYPLLTTALAVPLLGEKVGWRRWAAVGVGFIGVLIVLRPGMSAFHPAAIIPLVGALGFAFYAILTRMVSRYDDFSTTFFYTAFFGAVAVSFVGPFYISDPTPADWGWISVLCITGISGHYLLIKALEYAPASTLQPFNYLMIVSAAAVGFIAFGEIPDRYTVLGACVIAGSGLYVIWREHIRESLVNRKARSDSSKPH